MSVPAFLAAVHARSADGARAALSPTFQGKANGKPLDHDGQARLLEAFWLGFPDGDFTMEPTGGSGRHVITWTFKGTHGGVYLGVPPTGKPIEFSGFIIAVSDATGIKGLDWKWDTKVFTKAVLGPDDVGEIVVKDNFRDPSHRWSGGGRPDGPRRKKGNKAKGRPGQGAAAAGAQPAQSGQTGQQPGRPRGPRLGPDGQPLPPPPPRPVLGPDGQPVLGPDGQPLMQAGKRRRRGKGRGPKPGTAPAEGAAASAAAPDASAATPPSGPPSSTPEGA